MKSLNEFQEKLASLSFLDPACGSGNFLTETYISLRRLENDVISALRHGQITFSDVADNPIKVSIGQFYGIEINDFAVTVAKTALWIAESQMMKETEIIVHAQLDYLPLKTYANIIEGNALRMDWGTVAPKSLIKYIMGNPPFVGYSNQNAEQKADVLAVYLDKTDKPYKKNKKIDYVAAWYYKAAQFIKDTAIRAAFVSTNSVTQGEQVAAVWKPLFEMFGVHIDFAHRTFKWNSEAVEKAAVHCVIVGFSTQELVEKVIYNGERKRTVLNINPYLVDAPDVFIESRKEPLCDVPKMNTGNRPADGGNLIIKDADLANFIKADPKSEKYIRRFMGSAEFINGKKRWCLH
jgi:type II restriction/modification system DNA methylase subunit YeeA